MSRAKPGSRTLIGYGGAAGGGKANSINEYIPTPNGYKLHGQLVVGDEILGACGQVIKVIAVHPIEKLPAYRLTFDDGSHIDASDEHLWLTYDRNEMAALTRRDPVWRAMRREKRAPRRGSIKPPRPDLVERNKNNPPPTKSIPTGTVRTTKQIRETLYTKSGDSNYAIPLCEAVELPEQDLLIDPYLFGMWLGDGTAKAGSYACHVDDVEELIGAWINAGYDVTGTNNTIVWYIRKLVTQLKALGVFGNKHIPIQYLRGSKEQRLALIQGLMDTDGTVAGSGCAEFTNTNKAIIDGIYELIVSMGWKARVREGRSKLNGRDCGPKWTIKWTPSEYVFRLKRKRDKQRIASRRTTKFRYIKSIEPVGEMEMRCITVDNPTGLYLAGKDFIVTHNSYLLARMAFVLSISYPGNRILVGRQHLTDLKETTMREFYSMVPSELIMGRSETEFWCKIRMADWPKGIFSQVFFKGLENWSGKLSDAYGAVIIDEASEVDAEAAQYLLTRLRWRLPEKVEKLLAKQCKNCKRLFATGDTCSFCRISIGNSLSYFMLCASNPFPGFFTEWFYKRRLDAALAESGGVDSVHFVQALPTDNPHNDKGYVGFMRATLSPDMVARMVEGRFDVFVGRVYEAFNPEIHQWRHTTLPEYTRVVGGLDFGNESESGHFSAGIVRIVTRTGRSIRVDEFKERGPNIAERQSRWMLEMEEKWAKPIKQKGIDWRGDRSQMVGIQIWRQLGFNIRPTKGGPGSVDEGIKLVARRLNQDTNGIPGSFYLPHLKYFEEEMLEYRRDPETMKIVKRNDDLVDADRYAEEAIGIMTGDPSQFFKNPLPVVG